MADQLDSLLIAPRIGEDRTIRFDVRYFRSSNPIAGPAFQTIRANLSSDEEGNAKLVMSLKFGRVAYVSIAGESSLPREPLGEWIVNPEGTICEPLPETPPRQVECEYRELSGPESNLISRIVTDQSVASTELRDQLQFIRASGTVCTPGRITTALSVADAYAMPSRDSAPIEATMPSREGDTFITIGLAQGYLAEIDVYKPGFEGRVGVPTELEDLRVYGFDGR